MKIVSLQSIGLGDCDQVFDGVHPIPLIISVGHIFPFGFEKTPVTTIKLVEDCMVDHYPANGSWYYKVTTSDGHVRMLPERSYIAECAEAEDVK